jgi:hypothetical protein
VILRTLAIILSAWAVLYWPFLLWVAAADYFAPSALPPLVVFGLALVALAYALRRLADRSETQ